jgi:hypothetical protein
LKKYTSILFVLVSLLFINILVYKLNIRSKIIPYFIIFIICSYKETRNDSIIKTFNINTFSYKVTLNNILELISAYLMAFLLFNEVIRQEKSNLINLVSLVLFGLINYRFLFYNLSEKSTKRKE